MSEDELRKIVAAGAFGVAAYHLQNALITALVAKGFFGPKEAALIFEGARRELERPDASPTDLGELAKDILSKLEQYWAAQAKGH